MNEQYFTSLNGYYVKDKEAIHTYDSVAEMKADSKIREGSYVKTRGYHNVNDGGNGEYLIRTKTNDDSEDNGKIHFTQNNLVAELVNSEINVKLYGAYGDGLHDDINSIQNAIDNCPLKTIYFPEGTYSISNKIVIKNVNDKTVNLKFDDNAILKNYTNNSLTCLIEIGKDTSEGTYSRTSQYNIMNIKGGKIDCTNVDKGILINSDRQFVNLKNVNFFNITNYGLYLEKGTYTSGDSKIISCSFFRTDSSSGTAIYCGSDDNELQHIRIDGNKTAIKMNGGAIYLHDIHATALYSNSMTTEQKESTVAFDINNEIMVSEVYADTYATGFKINTSSQVNITNSNIFYYNLFQSGENTQAIWLNTNEPRLSVVNTKFNSPSAGNHKFFRLQSSSIYAFSIDDNRIKLLNNVYKNNGNVSYNDIAYCLQLNNERGLTPYYNGRTYNQDEYYYLCSFTLKNVKFANQIRIRNGRYFECVLQINSTDNISIIEEYNNSGKPWTFVIVNEETMTFDNNSTEPVYTLYVKIENGSLTQGVNTTVEPLTYDELVFSYRKLFTVGQTIEASNILASATVNQSNI